MHERLNLISLAFVFSMIAPATFAGTNNPNNPTWWDKYQYLKHNAPLGGSEETNSPAPQFRSFKFSSPFHIFSISGFRPSKVSIDSEL